MGGKMKQAAAIQGQDGKPLPEEYYKGQAQRGFKPRGGAPLKWEAGFEVEGKYVTLIPARDAESSPILVLENSAGQFRYYAPTILEQRLTEDFKVGEVILIVCLGKVVPSKKGGNAWGFEVFGK